MEQPRSSRARPWLLGLAAGALIAAEMALLWLAFRDAPLAPLLLLQAALVLGGSAIALLLRQPPVNTSTALDALSEALDILPYDSTFALFDPQERLVLVNARTLSIYPRAAPFMQPGIAFEDILRRSVALGEMPESQGEEAWIQQRLASFRTPREPQTQEQPDDRWLRISQRVLSDGSTVILRSDITDTIRKERALEQARLQTQRAQSQLYEALEAMPIGMELFDEHDRLVYFNHKMGELRPWFSLEEGRGQTYADLLRIGLGHGYPPEAIGHEEAWLAQRLAERGTRTTPEVRGYPNGLWMHAYETRTPSGNIITVRIDITELVQQRQALELANQRLALLSATDGLTGIANRRHFDTALATEWLRGARNHETLTLLLIDIDHFKLYNDHYGHLAGDACLRRVAQLLTGCVRRAGELVARYGGEEFVLLLPATDRETARLVAQHCMDALEQERIPHASSPTAEYVTLSIGIAYTVPDAEHNPESLVEAADTALYRAKNAGRQQFEVSRI
ncbi:diguanylate cyclase domain-containing protein [Rhodoferax sp.]|uniref:GGDEF domain-containing protein n=1 Tax=Rhodoferax sp. TaxID=50421 RepID=UPI00374DEF1F